MNSKEFSRYYAEKLNISYVDADNICETLFETLKDVLFDRKEKLVIRGLGTFKQVVRSEKKITCPTGEVVIAPAKEVVKFVQSPTI